MDFVAAKAILDKFANVYRAAEFMAEALDTAASLERRGAELHANVEHLAKEQAIQQQNLAAMQAAGTEAQQRAQQEHTARLAVLRAEHERLRDGFLSQRAQLEQQVAERKQALEEGVSRSHAILASLGDRITAREEELKTLEQQIEALKAQAREVLK